MLIAIILLSLACVLLGALALINFLRLRRLATVVSERERERQTQYDKGLESIMGYSLEDALKSVRKYEEED